MADTHFETLEKVVYNNDLEALKKEIGAGTDVNLQNKYGWTPLHIAIRRDRRDMVAYLLEEGADVSIANERGATAVMLVQKFGRESMVKYF